MNKEETENRKIKLLESIEEETEKTNVETYNLILVGVISLIIGLLAIFMCLMFLNHQMGIISDSLTTDYFAEPDFNGREFVDEGTIKRIAPVSDYCYKISLDNGMQYNNVFGLLEKGDHIKLYDSDGWKDYCSYQAYYLNEVD